MLAVCHSLGFIGLSGWGGGLAEYITLNGNDRFLHLLPDNVSSAFILITYSSTISVFFSISKSSILCSGIWCDGGAARSRDARRRRGQVLGRVNGARRRFVAFLPS